jgi:hypothetical protein
VNVPAGTVTVRVLAPITNGAVATEPFRTASSKPLTVTKVSLVKFKSAALADPTPKDRARASAATKKPNFNLLIILFLRFFNTEFDR